MVVPSRVCEICGEFLPHACAPVIIIRYQRGGNVELGKASKKIITIKDR